jgi:alpha-tubulin suppressor-like RCC1 family protein
MKKVGLSQCLLVLSIFASCYTNAQNMQISGGFSHTITLCETGIVMHAGSRANNQDGTGNWSGNNLVLTAVPGIGGSGNLSNIQMVDAGSTHHTIALNNSGEVIAFGNDYACQLGQGSAVYPPYPVYVKGLGGVGNLTGIKSIVGSSESSYAIRASDGALIGWGNNSQGQLGLGTVSPTVCNATLVNSPLNANVIQVDGGDNFTLALKADGSVYSMGENVNGQLGIGNTTDQSNPQQVLVSAGVPLTNIVSISCGDGASYAIKSDGTLWAWGHNGFGQLGVGTCTTTYLYATQVKTGAQADPSGFLQNVKQVAGGNAHAVIVLNNGLVYTMGSDQYGQLGDGIIAGADVCGVGVGCKNVPYNIASLSNIRAVSDGDMWSFAITNTGSVYAWGQNSSGQLGINSTTGTATPTAMNMGSCVVLPVELISFDAECKNQYSVFLTWSTASEKNSLKYEIERSVDGIHFTKVGEVSASGNSKTILNYEFIDLLSDAYGDQLYYRLKIVDKDNSYKYSSIKSIRYSVSNENEISIFPNPSSTRLISISFENDKEENISIKLFDITGKELSSLQLSAQGGYNIKQVSLPELSAGMYSLKIVFENKVADKKLIIQ